MEESPNTMAKVEFDIGIDSVRGILMGDDPFYIRRYPDKNGAIMHIVHARTKNLGTIATDIANFNAQKDNANGYKTLRQYLWHICAAEING